MPFSNHTDKFIQFNKIDFMKLKCWNMYNTYPVCVFLHGLVLCYLPKFQQNLVSHVATKNKFTPPSIWWETCILLKMSLKRTRELVLNVPQQKPIQSPTCHFYSFLKVCFVLSHQVSAIDTFRTISLFSLFYDLGPEPGIFLMDLPIFFFFSVLFISQVI